MTTYGMLLGDLYGALSAANDPALQLRIKARVNYEYFRICSEASWQFLRCPPVTLDFSSASDTTGLWLPPDLLGIDEVWDDTNGVEFHETTRQMAQADMWGYRYYTYMPSRADLFSSSDLMLDKGGSTFTSAALTADGTDPDGEYAQFGDSPGLYKITNSATPFSFEPTYHGENRRMESLRIRPWESSRKMVLVDPDEDALVDRSVQVFYWRQPTPLYRDADIVMLPSSEVLRLRTLRGIYEAKERYPVSERMLDAAKKEALRLNPPFGGIRSPRDKHGNRFDMGQDIFTER